MFRAVLVAVAALAAALIGNVGARVASAEPPPPCGYMVSAPEIVQVGGASMVTATVGPDVCVIPPAGPSIYVACLQLQGVDTGGTCSQSNGADSAQVYVPYRPGGTYVATGRGCPSWIGQAYIAPNWVSVGPVAATL